LKPPYFPFVKGKDLKFCSISRVVLSIPSCNMHSETADSFIFVYRMMIQWFPPMYNLQCSGMRGLGFLVLFFQRITEEKQYLLSVAFSTCWRFCSLSHLVSLVLSRILHFSNIIPCPLDFGTAKTRPAVWVPILAPQFPNPVIMKSYLTSPSICSFIILDIIIHVNRVLLSNR